MKHAMLKYIHLAGVTIVSSLLISCATLSTEEQVQHHLAQGEDSYKSGDYESATRELQSALELDPENTEAYYLLGVIHFREGRVEKARNAFTKVISLDARHAKAYYNLGVLYSSQGPFRDIEKARISFTKFLEVDPTASNREKVEHWLAENDPQRNVKAKAKASPEASPAASTSKKTPRSEESSPTDFKEWLKEQSGQIE